MRVYRPLSKSVVLLSALCVTPTCLQANPVTGWLKDTSFGGGAAATLTGQATDSPILGDGTSNDADNTAIYAPFPVVSLENGERITLTGSAEMIGTSTNADFRWGLFKDDGAPPATGGWLGYMASAESIVWSKNPRGSSFASTTFASVASGRGTVLGQTDEPSGRPFEPGTYDLSMTVDRFGNEMDVRIAISSDDTGFSIVSPTFTETDPSRLTFDFDRVGFLAGSVLDADQVRFGGIDVAVSSIEAPTLHVHGSGLVVIANTTSETVDLTHYEVTSNSGALNAAGWTSLDSQENNDPIGIGWEEAGGSGANAIGEVNLVSMSSLGVGSGLALGNAFLPGGLHDLAFRFTTPEGEVRRGLVNYVRAGDYNSDGNVDAADYTVWRDSLAQQVPLGTGADGDGNGVIELADYEVWKDGFSTASGSGGSVAMSVPEPSSIGLVCLALVARSIGRLRRGRLPLRRRRVSVSSWGRVNRGAAATEGTTR